MLLQAVRTSIKEEDCTEYQYEKYARFATGSVHLVRGGLCSASVRKWLSSVALMWALYCCDCAAMVNLRDLFMAMIISNQLSICCDVRKSTVSSSTVVWMWEWKLWNEALEGSVYAPTVLLPRITANTSSLWPDAHVSHFWAILHEM